MGDKLREWGLAVQWNTELVALEQHADRRNGDAQAAGRRRRASVTAAWVAGCDGARSAVRELNKIEYPGAPYQHVFFVADTEATGSMVRGRGQRLPVARRFSSLLPDAREGSLAPRRHPASGSARQGRRHLRRRDSVDTQRGGQRTVVHRVHMVFHVPHLAPERRALSRPPLLPPGRRRAHPQPGRRAGNEHRPAGCVQPWVEARARHGAARRMPRCSIRTRTSAFRSRERLLAHDGQGVPPRGFGQPGGRTSCRTKILARIAAAAMRVEAIQKAAFGIISQTAIHYRESPLSESADRVPSGAPRAGDRFPWLKVKLAPTGAVEDLFEKLDDTRFNLLSIGQPPPPADALDAGDLVRLHTIPVRSRQQRTACAARGSQCLPTICCDPTATSDFAAFVSMSPRSGDTWRNA